MENKLKWENLKSQFHESWHPKMQKIVESKEMWELSQFLKKRKSLGATILPDSQYIFRAFKETSLDKLKVVFVGLSPYFTKGVPDGLYFSCSLTQEEQPSLRLLLDGVESDLKTLITRNPDLTNWAKNGVLMLNSALTCEISKAEIHLNEWNPFIKMLYRDIFSTQNGLIFCYFGKEASKFQKEETAFIHYSKSVEHPSFANRQNREWKHENLFSWVNNLIKQNMGVEHIIPWENHPEQRTLPETYFKKEEKEEYSDLPF